MVVLTSCSNEKREEAVVRWFQWLIDNQNSYSRCVCTCGPWAKEVGVSSVSNSLFMDRCGNEGAYGEMLLLAAIHFQEKRRSQIMEMVSGTLGFSLQVGGATGTPSNGS